MRRQLLPAVRMFLVMTLLAGVAYTAVITGIIQLLFPNEADGSLVIAGDRVVGSALLAQEFSGPEYFHPRPSAVSYDGTLSGASNLGPTNPHLLEMVGERVAAYRLENGLDERVRVPVDAVTASASGLDPHISVANATLQASRVSAARGVDRAAVLDLVSEATEPSSLGFLSEPGVNVLELNLLLDEGWPSSGSTLEP